MKTRDLRIESIRPLISPAILLEELPLSDAGSITVTSARDELIRILDGEDDRLIVVVGPCSIHDPEAGLEYGRRLKAIGRRAGRRPLRRDAGLLREAAHDDRLEGADQRSAPRRKLPHERGAAAGPQAAARPARAGRAGRLRVPGPDLAAVHLRPDRLGRDRRADHREPGPPAACLGPLGAGRLQERHRRRASRPPSTRCGRPRTRTASSA